MHDNSAQQSEETDGHEPTLENLRVHLKSTTGKK